MKAQTHEPEQVREREHEPGQAQVQEPNEYRVRAANPLVSILTVTKNSEKTVERAIRSVLSQTYDRIEYLIIDGASRDHTVKIAQSFTDRFQERGFSFRIISEPDLGMYDALNKGARISSGDLIGQINSDDWYEPDAVMRMADLYKTAGYDMAFADIRMIRPDGSFWIKRAKLDRFVSSRYWNHPTQFTKRSLLLEHPYPLECMSDDLDLYLWIRTGGFRIEILNEVLANFTLEGMSHSRDIRKVRDRVQTKNRIYRRYGFGAAHYLYVWVQEWSKFILKR